MPPVTSRSRSAPPDRTGGLTATLVVILTFAIALKFLSLTGVLEEGYRTLAFWIIFFSILVMIPVVVLALWLCRPARERPGKRRSEKQVRVAWATLFFLGFWFLSLLALLNDLQANIIFFVACLASILILYVFNRVKKKDGSRPKKK